MDPYLAVKTLHILSSTILFGTGLGIAFFMAMSFFTSDIHEKFYAIRTTVLADYLFTAPAVVIQPLSGAWLVWQGGYDWSDLWLVWTYALYAIAGLCWLPVVAIQIKLKTIMRDCVAGGKEVPEQFHKLFRWWFLLGWPAFLGLIGVFFLMVMKPV